jgi:hypothetical protein
MFLSAVTPGKNFLMSTSVTIISLSSKDASSYAGFWSYGAAELLK